MIGSFMSEIVDLSATKLGSVLMTGRKRKGLRKLSADLISKAIDETNAQVTRIGLTLLGAAAFCVLSLFTPDVALLGLIAPVGGSEKINVPLTGPVGFADLRGAHLISTDLSGADLYETNLSGAHLNGANLRGANLHHANLGGADLCEADLSDVDLSDAVNLAQAARLDEACGNEKTTVPGFKVKQPCKEGFFRRHRTFKTGVHPNDP
jgi:uncharacterized protein YjbI with pentapeptide repeats